MNFFMCLKCDFMRVIWKGRLAKYLIFMTLFMFILFVTDDAFGLDLPVLYYLTYITSMHSSLLIFPVAFLIYGTSLIEDWKDNYWRQCYLRVSIKTYVISKALVNLMTSILSVLLSVTFSSILTGFIKSWSNNIGIVDFLRKTEVVSFYDAGNYLACVIYIGLQLGILSALLSSIAFFVSTFVSDKIFSAIMTFTGGMVIQYIWCFIDKKGLPFLGYFIISNNTVLGDHWLLKDILMMVISFVLSTLMTWAVLRRKVQFE